MFTGLIEELASVATLERTDAGATLAIRSRLAGELAAGDSIAVNGVCLTASAVDGGVFQAEVMAETLRRSSLGALREGDAVNLELPLRTGERLGGHIVQGHVDGTGTVVAVRDEGFARVLEVEVQQPLERYLVRKGSVALDGVSLTVSGLRAGGFEVSLIPETLGRTTLGGVREGDLLNIEVDILARQVERLMEAKA